MSNEINYSHQSCRTSSQKFITQILLVFSLSLLLTSCSCFNCTPLEGLLGGNKNLITFSYDIAEELIDTAIPPLVPRHPEMAILMSTFVDNNDLERTSRFGRILQEHIASKFVQEGYTVKEIKLAESLSINPKSGETILSRDLNRLNPDQKAQAILVGTFSRTNRTLYVSARLINPSNNNIIATDDFKVCMDDDLLAIFELQRQSDIDTPIEDPGQPFLNSIL
jgi:TolB-like protein